MSEPLSDIAMGYSDRMDYVMSQLLGRSSVLILRFIFGPTYLSTLKKEVAGCPEISLPKPHLAASPP